MNLIKRVLFILIISIITANANNLPSESTFTTGELENGFKYTIKKNSKPANKASISLTTSHEVGSLAEVLADFGKYDVNLSKIQSMPVIDEPWRYAFFADLIFKDYKDYKASLKSLETKVTTLKILGEYTRSKR